MKVKRRIGFMLGALSLGVVAATPGVSCASMPVNFGFEDGLSGWTVMDNGGSATVVDLYTASSTYSFTQYNPPAGEAFLLLDNGATGKSVKVSQTFSLNEGAVLSGYYAFSAPGLTFDVSAATMASETSMDILSSASLLTNLFAGSEWHGWEWTVPASGEYTLTYMLYNTPLDGNGQSFAMFDGASIIDPAANPVPVPAAAWLLGSALTGLLGGGIRKKRVATC